jgi:hypothetical protein
VEDSSRISKVNGLAGEWVDALRHVGGSASLEPEGGTETNVPTTTVTENILDVVVNGVDQTESTVVVEVHRDGRRGRSSGVPEEVGASVAAVLLVGDEARVDGVEVGGNLEAAADSEIAATAQLQCAKIDQRTKLEGVACGSETGNIVDLEKSADRVEEVAVGGVVTVPAAALTTAAE